MVKLPTPLQERGLAATEEKKALLTHGQVELLFSAVPVSVLANIVGALLAYFVFIDRVSPLRLQVWITLLLTFTAGHLHLVSAVPAWQPDSGGCGRQCRFYVV